MYGVLQIRCVAIWPGVNNKKKKRPKKKLIFSLLFIYCVCLFRHIGRILKILLLLYMQILNISQRKKFSFKRKAIKAAVKKLSKAGRRILDSLHCVCRSKTLILFANEQEYTFIFKKRDSTLTSP